MNIEELLHMTVERGASDLLLSVGSPPVLRIDKELVFTKLDSISPEGINSLIEPILEEGKKADFRKSSEMSFIYSLPGWGRFRITLFRQRGSTAAAVRRVPSQLPSLEELNLPEGVLRSFCSLKDGLVLVTGPTGGGKSTTLAAMVRMLNDEYPYHIVSIEEPIEYLFKHNKSIVEQRDIPYDTPSFSVALSEVLRQNADVVVVGEIIDPQTLRATLRIAESGILTMATFHTPTAAETLNRLLNFFPGEEAQIQRQLSLVLRGIFSQQLIALFQKSGLVPAWEVLLVNERIATLLRDGNIHQINNVIETGSKMGMQSMAQSLISLYERKLISKKDLLLRIKDKEREELKKIVSEEGNAEDNPL